LTGHSGDDYTTLSLVPGRGQLAILEKYLASDGVSQQAIGQLDDLYEAEEKRCKLAIRTIESLLKDSRG